MSFEQPSVLDVVATATDTSSNTAQATLQLSVIDTSDVDAPVVEITSPEYDQIITAPIDVVGTVADDNLLFYTVEIAPVVNGEFAEVFRGTEPVIDGVLGQLDPTLLENDSYVLRLTAQDAGGNAVSTETLFNVSGAMKVGNFTLSFVDLNIPVQGIPIVIGRTYDTLHANTSGDFGYGWRLELFDVQLAQQRARFGFGGCRDLQSISQRHADLSPASRRFARSLHCPTQADQQQHRRRTAVYSCQLYHRRFCS